MNFLQKMRTCCRPRWWAVALCAMVALVAADTIYHGLTTTELTWGHPASLPAPDSSSPSGYVDNEHVLILPYQGIDGYHWIMQTQTMLAGGGARIRTVDYDNAPDGREVHWASALRWWMAGLAWLDHAYTGTPLPWAVEEIAPYASTLLVVILIVLVTRVLARRIGSVPAALFAFGTVGVGPVYESFTEGRLDHHGLASLNAMLTVLFLVAGGAGWLRTEEKKDPRASLLHNWLPDRLQARRWFIAGGIVGGIGLWISAASEAPVLAEVGVGALLATGLLGRGTQPKDGARPDPSLWRVWGWSGAATSLFFYLLEYFPSHFGMRLEVNHPLYALTWAAGGELIFRLSRWWIGGSLAERPADRAWLVFGVIGLVSIPAVLLVAAEKVFWVNDHFLWVMHVDNIVEFTDLWTFLKSQWAGGQRLVFFLFANPLVLLVAPMLYWSTLRTFPRPLRALLLLVLPPGVITFGLSMAQVRWTEINYSLWLAVLVAVGLVLRLHNEFRWTWPRRITAGALLAWGLLLNPGYIIFTWVQTGWKAQPSQVEALEPIVRDASQHLRARVGPENAIVLSGPTSSTWLTFYGGFKTVGSYYWENLAGLKAAAKIYGATYDEANLLFSARRITYLVVFSFVDVPEEYARLARGLRRSDPAPTDAFVVQLQRAGQLPPWLRPIYYPLPEQLRKNLSISIYAWAPQQTGTEALTRLAQTQLDANRPAAAQNLLQMALSRDTTYVPALITLARLQISANDAANFTTTFQQLRVRTPLTPDLALDDRVDLASVYSRTTEQGLIREQLQLALRNVNTAALRTLRPDSLYNLLILARDAGLLTSRPALWQVGLDLLPASLRQQLLLQCADIEKAQHHPQAALALLRQALDRDSDSVSALAGLAKLLSTTIDAEVRDGQHALALAQQAMTLDGGKHAEVVDALACAYAETGHFTEAAATEQQAIALATKADAPKLAEILQSHLLLFQKQLPLRE